jgi:hypothetical protein
MVFTSPPLWWAPAIGHRVWAVRRGQPVEHPHQLAAQVGQPSYIGVQLVQPPAQQPLGRRARARAGVANGQQVSNVSKAQPAALRGLAE